MEEWRPVPGYEGVYEVSSTGRIKSLARTKTIRQRLHPVTARMMKQTLSGNRRWGGYPSVNLCVNARRKMMRVHRIVAAAFIGLTPRVLGQGRAAEKGNDSIS